MDRFLLPPALLRRQKEQEEANYETNRERQETEKSEQGLCSTTVVIEVTKKSLPCPTYFRTRHTVLPHILQHAIIAGGGGFSRPTNLTTLQLNRHAVIRRGDAYINQGTEDFAREQSAECKLYHSLV